MPTRLQRPVALGSSRGIARCCAALFLSLALFGGTAAGAQPREAEVKAAFVFNFAQFVDWPTNAFSRTNAPFIIGVAGSGPIEDALIEITRGEKVRGRAIEVRPVRGPTQADGAHILYIPATEMARWMQMRRRINDAPVLTVSDAESFARRGGMIELYSVGNKIRLRANPAAAKACELTLSSKLLRLAEIVETEEPR